ncbi:MAG: hypothetical protein B7Y80_20105 [Hyphomicrobium sp. 32-62-53]|nr:MAG: hypothetical protein B7Z29_19935 [Hyphomicrobium sp. 12-62-95]OYX97337.1 MAG: hypothetical protein B7Y80_20105 [Hyphomicrobium sp. 32-62-53]
MSKQPNRLNDLIWDRVGAIFQTGLVASDLRQNHIDAADTKAAATFLADERRHHPAAIAAALATTK